MHYLMERFEILGESLESLLYAFSTVDPEFRNEEQYQALGRKVSGTLSNTCNKLESYNVSAENLGVEDMKFLDEISTDLLTQLFSLQIEIFEYTDRLI